MPAHSDLRLEIHISTQFVVPAQLNYTAIKAWATHLRPYPDLAPEPLAKLNLDEDLATNYLRLCIDFAQILFQVCKIPVDDPPRLLSLRKNRQHDNQYQLTLGLNGMRFFPVALYERVYKASAYCTAWANSRDMSATNREQLYAYLQANLIKPLSAMVPLGKSTEPVLRAAKQLGIPFIYLGMGVYQVGWASKARRLDRSTTDRDSAIGSKLAHHKVGTVNLLRMAGMPTPSQRTFRSLTQINQVLDQLPYPVVIKPTDCARGEGVTIDVRSPEAVASAFEVALAASPMKQVLVENQIPGVCHRFLIAFGSMLYAVRRNPISVIADGKRTIEQLVFDECAAQTELAPWNRSEIKPIDAQALLCIKLAGYDSNSIPKAGIRVPLRRIESTQDGGIDDDVTELAHPDNIDLAVRAAAMLGLEVAGVDIISPDIARPWHDNGAVINEVNFAPLLGGAPISRSYLPAFLSRLIDGDGRIPIDVYDDQAKALAAFSRQRKTGSRCFYTSAQQTLDHHHNEVPLCCTTLADRMVALLCRSDVDAIVVWQPKDDGISA
jgi:D-alanine-D-alanine ligase-like ATP-grasp enzyme